MRISKTVAKASSTLVLALLCMTLLSACAGLAKPGGAGSDMGLAELWAEGSDAYAMGNYEAARMHYEALVEAAPENILALVRLGNIDYRMGDLAGARDYYQRALKVQPRQPQVHYNLAMVELSVARRHLGSYLSEVEDFSAGSPVSDLMTAIDRFGGMSDAVTRVSPQSSLSAQATTPMVAEPMAQRNDGGSDENQ